ncbi:damage-control phosphatase ARMT1 family protein [Actinoallomurus acaciae]|uniref:Damage-control phosphatase ARMT1 family protein n=1 Tax=Actinoallomurus acaciae TaxID=502577 RepID=A0ABV5YTI0_9ACTN
MTRGVGPGGDPLESPSRGFAPPSGEPEPLGNGPGDYGRRVLRERTPTLITEVRDRHPYGPEQRRALDALLEEIASGTMRPLGEGAPDRARWDHWGAAYFGRPWADVPFLWWESYFYRRLLEAVGFFTPGPWFWVDPFEYWKSAELRDATVAVPAAGERQALLPASLWGNQADLGFLFGAAGGPDASGGLVADDGALVWSALDAGGPNHVGVVADNAGRELLADLLLIDHLLRTGLAATVTLHLKPHPYYVSDATTADLVACLRRLAAADGEAAAVERRLSEAIGTGRLRLRAHAFSCAPWSYHHMPADLAEEFGDLTLTIMKGDLNYRRLVGDRAWPPTTPFAEVTAYFPGPVAALRTLKSDVVTGLDAATLSSLEASGGDWRTGGAHGLIQVRR